MYLHVFTMNPKFLNHNWTTFRSGLENYHTASENANENTNKKLDECIKR